MPEGFFNEVYKLVKHIPRGKVATYGQVAALLGKPRSARMVGWALNVCPKDVPWQRVINRDGMISIENMRATKKLQADLLQAEGVGVEAKNGNYWVNMKKYLWKK